jgi:tetratricopeptide (TPR) repeat protein
VATGTPTVSDVVDKPSEAIDPTDLESESPSPAERIADIMSQAEQAEIDQDLSGAIERYWEAIAIDNQRASIWSQLAQTYKRDQQLKNAESTALEAIRLDTNNINYTLNYLRIIQNFKAPKAFLAELETAYARFPLSPEITLSLARAYQKISMDVEAARQFYQRFIEIAPAHPLRPEADAALQ